LDAKENPDNLFFQCRAVLARAEMEINLAIERVQDRKKLSDG